MYTRLRCQAWALALACLTTACAAPAASTEGVLLPRAEAPPEVPVVVGEPWRIATVPDLGQYASREAQVVDFSIWRAADGTYQLVACVRRTGFAGKGRLLFRFQANALSDTDWRPLGVFLTSEDHPEHRLGQLRAPHVVQLDGRYYMLYDSGGAAFVLVSDDGKRFERLHNDRNQARFFEMSRDVMLLDNRARDERLYAYYTWVQGSRATVGMRTARRLGGTWSAPIDVGVNTAPKAGDPWAFIDAESPFVLFHRGYYYRWEQMNVFVSDNPRRWPDPALATMHGRPRAFLAPEVIEDRGQFYLAGYQYDATHAGVYLSRFVWEAD